ncbi:hypothetical protein [Sulfurimonas sp. NWX367]|uniref:hypothetical protein n=1 Tax=Sulfurimonas sp. NWX367 TaxID=2925413 RepID=UPI0032048D5F
MGFFTAIGFIVSGIIYLVKFVKNYLLKYVTFGVILGIQFTITAGTIVFVSAFYFASITLFISLYNSAVNIINTITTQTGLDCFFGMLMCTGVTPAIQNGISMFFAALVPLLVFHLGRFTIGAFGVIKDELYKLGVLLGLAAS